MDGFRRSGCALVCLACRAAFGDFVDVCDHVGIAVHVDVIIHIKCCSVDFDWVWVPDVHPHNTAREVVDSITPCTLVDHVNSGGCTYWVFQCVGDVVGGSVHTCGPKRRLQRDITAFGLSTSSSQPRIIRR
eukprot:PhF_6_TR9709/c0_g1_i1/m.14942